MRFFLDTADIDQIKELLPLGLVDGITTNPSLIYKAGKDFKVTVKEICDLIPDGDVSAEVVSTDYDNMMREADILSAIADNVVVKLPLTFDGLRVCRELANRGTSVNMTLCFSAAQALLAAKSGATYVSPFIGRLDDISANGIQLISECVAIFRNYPELGCQVLAASLRHPMHVTESAIAGADVGTLPPALLKQLLKHPLTDSGLKTFVDDWAKTGQKL